MTNASCRWSLRPAVTSSTLEIIYTVCLYLIELEHSNDLRNASVLVRKFKDTIGKIGLAYCNEDCIAIRME